MGRKVEDTFTRTHLLARHDSAWHRHLVARKWIHARTRVRRAGVITEIRRLNVRMADANQPGAATAFVGCTPQQPCPMPKWHIRRPCRPKTV
jgi:hypothetical protein